MLFLKWCLRIFFYLALVVLYLRYIERRSIFYPAKEIEYLPGELNLEFDEVFFDTRDKLKIHGWFVPAKDAQATILFAHGNAGNISHRLEKIKFFHDLNYNVFIFDYRGYGKSKGSPSEQGIYLDIQAAYSYLLAKGARPQQIIAYGESLGAAVAVDLALKNKAAALILEEAFSSTKDMAGKIYPFLPYWVLATRFDSVKKIRNISAPKLIIHSINDEIVPYNLGRKLYENALEPKEFLQIHGGHNTAFFDSQDILKEKIGDFLNKLRNENN